MNLYRLRLWIACGIICVVFLNMRWFSLVAHHRSATSAQTLIQTDTLTVDHHPVVIDTTSAPTTAAPVQEHPRACALGYAQLPTDWGAITKGLIQRATPRKIIHFTVFDCEVRLLVFLLLL